MLDEQEISHMLSEGKARWLEAETFTIAYHERYIAKARLAAVLRAITIMTGVMTALSTIPILKPYDFTTVVAVITAISAVVSQVLVPEKVQRDTWDIWKKMELLKSDISSRCRGLRLAKSYAEEQMAFKQFNNDLHNLCSSDIGITQKHKDAAQKNLQNCELSPPPAPPTPQIVTHDDEGMDEEQGAIDLSNVKAVGRRSAQS